MKSCFTLAICLLIFTSLSAQRSDRRFSGRYAADFGPDEKEYKCAYQWVVTKTAQGGYIRRYYFPETHQLTGLTHYADKRLSKQEGPHRAWTDDGKLKVDANYREGLLDGPYTAYHHEGEVAKEGLYLAGEKIGRWSEFDRSGRLQRTVTYLEGFRSGEVIYFDTLGTELGSMTYAADTAVGGVDTLAIRFGFEPAGMERETMPLFPGCETYLDYGERKLCADRKMLEFVYTSIRYPVRARRYGVEGMAVVSFVIERDGTVGETEVLRGISEDIRAEVTRIVGLMPRWEPGTQDGVPVRVLFNLPVRFMLE